MILGIDYGLKRIGLAMADEKARIAIPFGVIENQGFNETKKKLQEIIKKENISLIVVGLPTMLTGEEKESAEKTRQFVDKIKSYVSVPIVFEDERFTTKMVKNLMTKYKSKYSEDAVAAMIILQSYLDRQSL